MDDPIINFDSTHTVFCFVSWAFYGADAVVVMCIVVAAECYCEH